MLINDHYFCACLLITRMTIPSLFNNNTKKIIYLFLSIALIIHVIQAIQAVGYFHPDQHFSIIEFASYKLGFSSADQMAWEFPNKVRPTIQVYLFLGYYHLMDLLNLGEAYISLAILRVIVVLINFLLFNYVITREFKSENQNLLIIVLLVANFSWFYPYHKTMFNSENFGAIFYFGSILLYQHFKSKSLKIPHSFLIGLLLSLSFYFRFQMGFSMIGLGIWFLFYEKLKVNHILALSSGFLLGVGLNTLIDSLYYGDFNFIPFTYWKINIIDKRAANLGTSSFLYYVIELALILSAPILSFMFLYYLFRGFFKKFGNPYVLSVIFFLLFHFFIGHKEERFLFPVFGILPVILGYGLRDYIRRIHSENGSLKLKWGMKAVVIFSVGLNFILLYLMLTVPYSQSIYFTKVVNQYFTKENTPVNIISYYRSPYETPGGNFHGFYWHFKDENVNIETITDRDEYESLLKNPHDNTYFAITYDRMVNNQLEWLDHKYSKILSSSKKATNLNRWLNDRNLFIIPDVWLLYKPRDEIYQKNPLDE